MLRVAIHGGLFSHCYTAAVTSLRALLVDFAWMLLPPQEDMAKSRELLLPNICWTVPDTVCRCRDREKH